jgi:hypothetical protein
VEEGLGINRRTKIESSDTVDATVQRGQASWTYIYITLGFAISIEGTIAGMIPIFPWNIILYLIVAALTGWFWIKTDWLHEKLIGLKNRYEAKAR